MYLSTLLFTLLPFVASTNIPSTPQYLFSNPTPSDCSSLKIPTSYESAIQARRILHLTPLGTLSTIFPTPQTQNAPSTLEHRPADVSGLSIGLMDYIADCESSGNPTILAINIATSFKNAAAGSNISLSLQWTPPYPPSKRISLFGGKEEAIPYSAANLPRFALLGYLEKIPAAEAESQSLGECFLKTHKDSKYWLPGNSIHESEWVRLVVQEVYWIGGFGDRAYIGWIPIEEWKNVTKKEWEGIKLPGEKKGWKEWVVEGLGQWDL